MDFSGDDAFLAFASVVRPHGVRGKIKFKAYSGSGEGLFSVSSVFFKRNRLTHLIPPGKAEGDFLSFPVVSLQEVKGGGLLLLEGINDVDRAKSLVGREIYVRRKELPKVSEEEFYVVDLEGLKAVDLTGRAVGRVIRVIPSPAHDILEVRTGKGILLIPFVQAFVPEVREKEGVIVVDPLKGFSEDEV